MQATTVAIVLVTLLIGAVIGVTLARLFRGQRTSAEQARQLGELAALRGDLATARAELSNLRSVHVQERLDATQNQNVLEQAKREVAEARVQASTAEAHRAQVEARLAAAQAERDAANARAQQLAEDREAMVHRFEALSAQTLERHGKAADATAEDRLKKTEQLLNPVADTLRQMQERLTEVEKARSAMSAELAEQVRTIMTSNEVLRKETHSLASALRAPQIRGSWGEQTLKRLVEVAGMVERCDFFQQASTRTEDGLFRPDLTIRMAGDKTIFVDSKVPLVALLDAYNTENEAERAGHLQRFAKAVRTHIDDLSKKGYWALDAGSPEFVVMFLASEESFYAAMQQQPDLQEYAASKQIVLASPSTLIAVLKAVAQGWQRVRLAETAAEVQSLGRELYQRLAKLGNHFDGVGRGLQQAVKAYNSTIGSLESRVMVTARKFNELETVSQELIDPLGPVKESPREITAPELLATMEADPVRFELQQLTRPEPTLDELEGLAPPALLRDGTQG